MLPEAPFRSDIAGFSSPVPPEGVTDAEISFLAAYGTKADVPARATAAIEPSRAPSSSDYRWLCPARPSHGAVQRLPLERSPYPVR